MKFGITQALYPNRARARAPGVVQSPNIPPSVRPDTAGFWSAGTREFQQCCVTTHSGLYQIPEELPKILVERRRHFHRPSSNRAWPIIIGLPQAHGAACIRWLRRM